MTFANNVILAFLGFIQLKYPVPSIFYMKKVNWLHIKTSNENVLDLMSSEATHAHQSLQTHRNL